MKYVLSFVLILFFSLSCLAQDKKSEMECNTFTLKAYSNSNQTTENVPGKITIQSLLKEEKKEDVAVINLDELPDKIIIHCSDEGSREQDIVLTRRDLFRLLQFVSFLLPQINEAWEMDQPRNSK